MYSESVGLKEVTGWERGGKLLFHRLNWSVPLGGRVLLMGNSGSGRRELFDMIAGYKAPQEGTVTVNGKLAVIREQFPLLEAFTLKEYLALALDGAGLRWNQDETGLFLKEHGLWDKREYKSGDLSIGERCRLQFALAEVIKPDVLLMEPCWKYLQEDELGRFWGHVRERIDKTQLSFISFSDVLFMGKDEQECRWLNWFSHIYIMKNGTLTELEKRWKV